MSENAGRKKTLTLFFDFGMDITGKDVFLAPYYIGKAFNFNIQFVYANTKTIFDNKIRGVNLIRCKNIFAHSRNRTLRELCYIMYLFRCAKKIDVLMRFHICPITALIGMIYKLLNPKGFFYVKADGGNNFVDNFFNGKTIRIFFKKIIYSCFVRSVDLISVETEFVYNQFKNTVLFGVDMGKKTTLLLNGFDKEKAFEYRIEQNDFFKKENIIITCGRLGTKQKNTDMLLDAVSKIDLKDWKVIFIGPLESREIITNEPVTFENSKNDFFRKNPGLKDKIIFTGQINDKKNLWQWYNRAKVFVLTSRFESSGIVLNEAIFFKNYIVSTDTGAASDIIKMSSGYGELIPQEDSGYLSKTLQNIIDSSLIKNKYESISWKNVDISWDFCVENAFNKIFTYNNFS